MTTKRHAEANRRNAMRSTGPTTIAGRERSRMSALKHGLTAEEVTVSEEEARKFAAFRDDMVEALAPVGVLEEELVQRIATCFWRLRRVPRCEVSATIRERQFSISLRDPIEEFMSSGRCQHLTRYEIAIDRMLQRALHDLERWQARRLGQAVAVPMAVDVIHSIDADIEAEPGLSHPQEHSNRNGPALSSPAAAKQRAQRRTGA